MWNSTVAYSLLCVVSISYAIAWVVAQGLGFQRYTQAVLQGPGASRAALWAWGISLASHFTGPLGIPLSLFGAVLAGRELRRVRQGSSASGSRIPAWMAILSAVGLHSLLGVILFVLYSGGLLA